MTRWTRLAVPLLVALVTALTSVAIAQEGGSDAVPTLGPNLLITLHVGGTDPGVGRVDRTYKMAAISGRPANLLMGWRTPIPSETEVDPDGTGAPVTTYVYQNVGMTAHLQAVVLGGGRVHLRGEVEISGGEPAREEQTPGGRPPVIGTFQQSLEVILAEGKTLRVAEVPDPDGGTHFLEITVEVIP